MAKAASDDREVKDRRRRGLPTVLTAAPAVGVALLPKITCLACWPAYAALASAMGLGAFNYGSYLLPLTLGGLALAWAGLAFRAKRRRGYGPLALGVVGGVVMLVGKFGYGSQPAMYGGIVLLIGARSGTFGQSGGQDSARPASRPVQRTNDGDEPRNVNRGDQNEHETNG